MKSILFISFIILSTSGFGQTKDTKGRNQLMQSDSTLRVDYENVKEVHVKISLFGDFKVVDYIKLKSNSPNPIEMNLLLGSLVRIQESSITGDEISPMSFEIYGIEKMTVEDYLYRISGFVQDSTIDQLPKNLNVHKTDHSECYGIVSFGIGKVAIPYRGTLLILERRQ